MRTPLIGGVMAALCLGFLVVSTLLAQRPAGPPPSQTGTVLVNVLSLTQNATRLKQSLEALKHEYDGNSTAFKRESERGNQLTEKLRALPPNSPDYKKLEREIIKARADFELHGKRVTEETRDRESRLYYAFSRELQGELARFAPANGIQLVLRYDSTPPELTDPRVILQEIHKLVVYQRGLEVTPPVLEAMNRGAAATTATNRPPASTRPMQR